MSQPKNIKLSVCIATHNMKQVLWETIQSLRANLPSECEIIVYDDCSTDGTDKIKWFLPIPELRYIRGKENVGVGNAFNAAVKEAKGDYIMLMCADDILIDWNYVPWAIKTLDINPYIGYITRYYYQYIDWDYKTPVRAWRCKDPVHLANNPSGLIFRKKAFVRCENKMFIETSYPAYLAIDAGWGWKIYPYDTIAVRVWNSTSRTAGYWLKRRVSSPVLDWWSIGVDMTKEYVSFIQIKNGFKTSAVIEEMINFVKLRPLNLISPRFWFFGLMAIITPRFILRKIPEIYRSTWGKWTTKKVLR